MKGKSGTNMGKGKNGSDIGRGKERWGREVLQRMGKKKKKNGKKEKRMKRYGIVGRKLKEREV